MSTPTNGLQRYPFLAGVDMPAVLVSHYADELPPSVLAGVGTGVLVTLGLGFHFMPEPIVWPHLLCELLWSAAVALALSGLGSDLDEDAATLSEELGRDDEANLNRAFADGRASVVSTVADASRRARRAFDASKEAMNPMIRAEVERRFDEVHTRLADLGGGTGPAVP